MLKSFLVLSNHTEIRDTDVSSSVKDGVNKAVFFPPCKANWLLYK